MTRTVISPVCTIGGNGYPVVNYVQQDPTTHEIFVQCYRGGGNYDQAIAVFNANGTLNRAALIDTDGAGGRMGWSGQAVPLAMAPGGDYIICASPLGTEFVVLNRSTLAHVQHAGPGSFHRSLAVSEDETWAYGEGVFYNIAHNAVGIVGPFGAAVPCAFDALNNLYVAKGAALYKYTPAYSGSVSATLVGTFAPLGSTSINGLSYLHATNLLLICGADSSLWLWDIATGTILRQAVTGVIGAEDFVNVSAAFNDYKPLFYDVVLSKAVDGNFYIACPFAGTVAVVSGGATWGVNNFVVSVNAIYEHTNGNIWAPHNFSVGDPNLGIEILPYALSVPAEPTPTPPPYNPGSPHRTRAWTYTMDGHTFYVLNLEDQGTFAYDIITKQWSQFVTQGYTQWNMHNGVMWDKRPVGGDVDTGQVYELDPGGAQLDEGFRDIQHIVTGGVITRDRVYVSCSGLRVTGSAGSLDELNGSALLLRFSDDDGNTWSDFFSFTLTESDFSADIFFASLGSFNQPGRIFELSDTGGLIRIDGCDAMLNGFNADPQQQSQE